MKFFYGCGYRWLTAIFYHRFSAGFNVIALAVCACFAFSFGVIDYDACLRCISVTLRK